MAGDEDSYEVFADIFDPVIEGSHGGYPKTATHRTDLDPSKVNATPFDPNYVLSCRVRTGRNIRGYALPPQNTRAERRDVEQIIASALSKLGEGFKGMYCHNAST